MKEGVGVLHAITHERVRRGHRNIPHLHDWPTPEADAVELQNALASRVDVSRPLSDFELVAGCEMAYHLTAPELFAAVALVRVSDRAVVETRVVTQEVNFPYIPGLLSFRELPALLTAFTELAHAPNAVMLDGQGIAHPRRFGAACHLGLWLDLLSLRCAKRWLIGEREAPGPDAGDMAALKVGDETVGVVMRSAIGARPVFVSPGHRIDVTSATALVRATLSGFRQSTPTRLAHMAANAHRAEFRV